MQKQVFLSIFTPFCEYFKTELSPRVIDIYYDDLADYSANELIYALKYIRQNRKYPTLPTIAEIIEALEGDIEEKIILARKELKDAMDKYGSYRSVAFKDKTIMTIVNSIGGWLAFGMLEGDKLENFYKWEFGKLYKAFYKHPKMAPSFLIGEFLRHKKFNGLNYDKEIIYLIGFEDERELPLIEYQQKYLSQNILPLSSNNLAEQKKL